MQIRHPAAPIFDASDVNGDDAQEKEECGCICHVEEEDDDE